MLYTFKLVDYANSGENGTAVHIKISMLVVEITGMLYMGNLKIKELYNTILFCVSKHSYYYCTIFVDSFFPSRLSSVQETPFMSAAWKTILKQVC